MKKTRSKTNDGAESPADEKSLGGKESIASGRKRHGYAWLTWGSLNFAIGGVLLYSLYAPASSLKVSFLPGETSHGHHQIEMACNACHWPETDSANHSAENVMQNACIQCHGEQLKEANDTHPAKKFNDPVNAEKLATLDAQDCLTCHREHVPERTLPMGLTMPADYCWHCHQDIAESRPSHQGMAFDSFATAGCHNYHDNRALYEKFLDDHFGDPDFADNATVPARTFPQHWKNLNPDLASLSPDDADGPVNAERDPKILQDWSETAHAAAGVNCTSCHVSAMDTTGNVSASEWSDAVSIAQCETCHERQVVSFQTGKHGMRLALGLSSMKPEMAKLPMHAGAAHKELTCVACHSGHRFDRQYAAVTACQSCHADSHTTAYGESSHAALWAAEISGTAPAGSGVSCATCHLPRLADGDEVYVHHDQNDGLRPTDTMARQVCLSCHSLEYSLSVLVDPDSVLNCFSSEPSSRIESVEMAHDWFAARKAKRASRSPSK